MPLYLEVLILDKFKIFRVAISYYYASAIRK